MSWPGQNQGAKRCAQCQISYPLGAVGEKCDIHGCIFATLPYATPDADWLDKLAAVREEIRMATVMAERAGLDYPVVEEDVYEEAGLLWLSVYALVDAGILDPRADMLVWVGSQLYELQGNDDPRRRWWVEPISLELDIPVKEESCAATSADTSPSDID